MIKTVDKMKHGEKGRVISLGSSGALRCRLIDLGITPGAIVILQKAAPLGDPLQLNVRGYELTIRKHECSEIKVEII